MVVGRHLHARGHCWRIGIRWRTLQMAKDNSKRPRGTDLSAVMVVIERCAT